LLGGASSAAVFLAVGLPALVVTPAWGLEFMRVWVPLCLLLSIGTFAISILLSATMRYGVQCKALLPRANLLRPVFLVASMVYVPVAAMAVVGGLSWDAVGDLWRESPVWLASVFVVALCGAVWTGAVFVRRCIRSASDMVRVPRELWKESMAAASVLVAVFAALAWGGVSLARAVNGILLQTYPLFRPWADAPALAGIAVALLLFIRAVQRRSDAMLLPWFELTRLLGCAGQSLPPATRDWLIGYVALCHAETGGYAWCPGARSDLDSTWNALSILAATGTAPPNPILEVQWVLRHQAAGGGFARREGGTPSLSATRAALGCLGYLQHELPEDKREALIRWVAVLQKSDGSFGDDVEPDRSGIEATSDAVVCLQRLGGLDRIDGAAARHFVFVAWVKSARTVDETYWTVHVHCVLGGLCDSMAVVLRLWCMATVPGLLCLSPRRYAGPLYKALWVLEQLPQTGDEALRRAAGLLRARAQQVAQATRSH